MIRRSIHFIVICALLAGCSSPRIYSEIRPGQEFPSRWLKKKTSLEEIERAIADVGSGVEESWLVDWRIFSASYQPGVEVWDFEDEAQWDLHLVGYVLMRDGRLVASIGGIRKKPNKTPQTTPGSSAPLRV